MFDVNSIIQRNDGIVQAEIDGDTVMMSIEQGAYYGLDPIASRIWALIETPASVSVICKQLVTEYDVTPEQCQADVIKFLSAMFEHDVIRVG